MQVSPGILLILLCLLGGFIAYLGDWLGRKMGKKRLRISKLRPRHTAILFTVVVGAIIPAITSFALISFSEPVREWIVRGPALISEVRDLTKERVTLQAEVTTQRNTLVAEQRRITTLTEEKNVLQSTTQQIREETKQAVAAKEQAERAKNNAEKRVEEIRKTGEALTAENAEFTQRNSQLQSQNGDLGRQNLTLTQANSQLEDELQVKEGEVSQLQRTLDSLKGDKAALDNELFDLKAQRITLNTDLEALRAQLREAQQLFGRLMAGLEAARESEIVLRKSEELARIIIPGGLSRDAARDQIVKLAVMANTAALERGVQPDSQGRAAALLDRQRRNPDGSFTNITAQQFIDSFVDAISRSTEELVLAAVSFYNYFEEDSGKRPVPLDLGLAFNRLIYRRNAVIATASVDASLSESDLVRFIADFISSQVRQAALRAGLLPIFGRNQGIAPVSVPQVNALIRQIRQTGGAVIVDAIAAEDTKAADLLTLDFHVRRAT